MEYSEAFRKLLDMALDNEIGVYNNYGLSEDKQLWFDCKSIAYLIAHIMIPRASYRTEKRASLVSLVIDLSDEEWKNIRTELKTYLIGISNHYRKHDQEKLIELYETDCLKRLDLIRDF